MRPALAAGLREAEGSGERPSPNGTITNRLMSGTLYLVATPIGNLEDITLRALRILRSVEVIAAEDTRRTARLLAHFGIDTKMVSCHQHNQHARVPESSLRVGHLR